MPYRLMQLRVALVAAGMLLAAFPLPAAVSPWFLLGAVLLTGIPHGAIDHVLFGHSHRGPRWRTALRFYGTYGAVIGAFAVLWWLAAPVAMGLFLLASAYHFGQTQLAYLRPTLGLRALALVWGAAVLLGMVLANPGVLRFGLTDVYDVGAVATLPARGTPWLLAAAAASVLGLIVSLRTKPVALLLEFTELVVLALVFLRNDFYTSFGLFFGGWHALNAIHHALADVGRFGRFRLREFVRAALPHAVLSIGGIAGLWYLSTRVDLGMPQPLLLFVALSVLALPHIVVLEDWYAFLARRRPRLSARVPATASRA